MTTDRARLTELLQSVKREIDEDVAHLSVVDCSDAYATALGIQETIQRALSALRRESAAPDGGLSRAEVVALCEEAVGLNARWTRKNSDLLRDMALRSLERPAGRVVPEEPTQEDRNDDLIRLGRTVGK